MNLSRQGVRTFCGIQDQHPWIGTVRFLRTMSPANWQAKASPPLILAIAIIRVDSYAVRCFLSISSMPNALIVLIMDMNNPWMRLLPGGTLLTFLVPPSSFLPHTCSGSWCSVSLYCSTVSAHIRMFSLSRPSQRSDPLI